MREQLTQYVELLFAGSNSEEIKQEILQNTLDRYDDLVSQGKTPEAAYRLAISGIGDVNEILDGGAPESPAPDAVQAMFEESKQNTVRLIRSIAICLYIISPVPLFLLSSVNMDELGLCGTLAIIAIATALLIFFKNKQAPEEGAPKQAETAQQMDAQKEMKKSIGSLVSTLGLAAYFIVSFATGAWYITWLIFPILGSVKGIINACIDLKGAN